MIRVCCSMEHQGDRVFGEKDPVADKSFTHGYCENCLSKELEKVEKFNTTPRFDFRICDVCHRMIGELTARYVGNRLHCEICLASY